MESKGGAIHPLEMFVDGKFLFRVHVMEIILSLSYFIVILVTFIVILAIDGGWLRFIFINLYSLFRHIFGLRV